MPNAGPHGKARLPDSRAKFHLAAPVPADLASPRMWAFLSRNRDAGLLMLRLTLGAFFLWAHGWGKLAGGTETWHAVGGAMKHFGITFWPTFWGFLATMAETVGIVLIMLGVAFRPACLFVAATMTVAGIHEWYSHKSFAEALKAASHAWELGIVFYSLIFIGPGKYGVQKD
jgi:putative oxidoreductase